MLDLGTEGKHLMEIVVFDTDDRADGNGKAGITWISKDLLNSTHNMNTTRNNNNGWATTNMRNWLRSTILPAIDSAIRNSIVEVNKTYYDKTTNSTLTQIDTIWIPSVREIENSVESSGATYNAKFDGTTSRIKKCNGNIQPWWTRSAQNINSTKFWTIGLDGNISGEYANITRGVALGFCTN